MKYSEQNAIFGDRGGSGLQMRSDKVNYLIKGFHQDKETYLGSIVNLIWATNPTMMENLVSY